ncbi:MAG: SUMF1/EgtB/PvdO family nonheme iron enzyme [Brumimicrobium sp.]|nr:SUMF1/EgtB/PvdO family nonheme iron enzyme [Brumimicrobium sp.]
MKPSFLLVFISLFLFGLAVKEPNLPKPFKKQFKFIPSGLVVLEVDTFSVQSFYMLNHEVTNKEYSVFLQEVKTEKPEIYNKVLVDSTLWRVHMKKGYFEPMEKVYHSHPAYADYPVVNITKEAAELYCEWLGEKINRDLADGQKIKVRLPYRAEFVRAGSGDKHGSIYAWGDHFMRNPNGEFRANFILKPQSTIGRDEEGNAVFKELVYTNTVSSDYFLTAPSVSYSSNEFGIYNLNGNVAEWLIDTDNRSAGGSWYDYGYDIRLQSLRDYGKAAPQVGFRPVFTFIKD